MKHYIIITNKGKDPKLEVTEFSDLYPNKGTKKFHRAYVEVRKSNVKEQ